MWGFFQNRGFYQFTNGFTTQTATNDGTGAALASLLLGLPAVKQRQAGIPEMDLRQSYLDGFFQDDWRVTNSTTLNLGVRYEFATPLADVKNPNSNLIFQDANPTPLAASRYAAWIDVSQLPQHRSAHRNCPCRSGPVRVRGSRRLWDVLYAD
jgi:outer membrane receptor protein involved in Fe transport